MPDFFPPNRELTIEEIVKLTGAKPRPDTPLDRRIRDIAPLDRAPLGLRKVALVGVCKQCGRSPMRPSPW